MNYISSACPSVAFFAKNAQSWARLMKKDLSTGPSVSRGDPSGTALPPFLTTQDPTADCARSALTAYAVLAGVGASICGDRIGSPYDALSRERHRANLISWHHKYSKMVNGESDPHFLTLLWHWTCMSNHVDLHRLELAIGKRGPVAASTHASYVREWSNSADSRRCLMHAFLLQKNYEEMLHRRVAAIHVPRCLFSAAIVWSVYLNSLSGFPPSLPPAECLQFPELRMLGINFSHQWQDVIGFRKGSLCAVKANTLCTLADMLRQMSHWDIARKFANILAPLIHAGTDDSMVPR